MNEILKSTREFMKQGLPESEAYKIALANYNKKHGFVFKAPKKRVNPRRAAISQESNDNRIRDFIMHPEVLALQQLEELQLIRRLLEEIRKTKTL